MAAAQRLEEPSPLVRLGADHRARPAQRSFNFPRNEERHSVEVDLFGAEAIVPVPKAHAQRVHTRVDCSAGFLAVIFFEWAPIQPVW